LDCAGYLAGIEMKNAASASEAAFSTGLGLIPNRCSKLKI